MNAPLRLHYAPDNASLIVRLTLEELGIGYETVLVDRSVQAQSSPAYRRMNPHGLIPTLETPDGPVFETAAILLWLADRHGKGAPAPDSTDRAAFLAWLFFTSNTLHTDLRATFYPAQYVGDDTTAQATLRRVQRTRLRKHLANIDNLAASRPSWLDGAQPSPLCYYLACLLRWMALYPQDESRDWFDLANTPHLARLATALEARPAVHTLQAAEGLGPTPFTAPTYCTPPEGSAT